MSEGQLEAKTVIENNSIYKIKYYYTDNHWIDHSVIVFDWDEYIIRYKKKDLDKIKLHILQYIRREMKHKKETRMPFKMWLKDFKYLYW